MTAFTPLLPAAPEAAAAPVPDDAVGITRAAIDALQNDRLDEAHVLIEKLHAVYPDPDTLMVFTVLLAIQRGAAREALRELEALPGVAHAELKALCLFVLEEPSWQGHAQGLEHSEDPFVRRAMRQLLGRPDA